MIVYLTLISFILIDKSLFLKYLQDNYPNDNNSYQLYMKIYYTIKIVYNYVMDWGIIFSYIIIFISYRRRVQSIT